MRIEEKTKLVEKYDKMTYEELEKIENDPNLPYEEYVIVAVTLALKEEEAGIKGIPWEEAYDILLGNHKYKTDSNEKEGIERFGWNKKLYRKRLCILC